MLRWIWFLLPSSATRLWPVPLISRICSVSAFCWPLLAHLGPYWLLTGPYRLRTPFFGLRDTPVSTQNLSLFHFLFLKSARGRFRFFFGFRSFFGSFWSPGSGRPWPALAGLGRPWQATAGPGRLRQALAGLSLYVRVRSAPACPSQPSTGPAAAIRADRA